MTNIRRAITICLLAALFLGWLIFGYCVGVATTEKAFIGNSRSACKVEIDEDTGEVVIHTSVGNLKTVDGYLVVKGGTE